MAKRIFVTYTPFHILTACGLASEIENDREKILIVFKDFPNSEIYYDAIMEWKGNPFKDVVVMDAGTQSAQKTLRQRFGFSRGKLNMITIFWRNNLKEDVDGYHVYSFNDDTVETQFLYWKNKKEQNYYLEDGFSSYYFDPHVKNVVYHMKKILRKILFGFWVERPYPLGTSKKVSKVYSYYPANVIEQLKTKEVVQLSPSIFDSVYQSGLIGILGRHFHIPEISDNGPMGIILFPLTIHLESLHLELHSVMKNILAFFASRGENYNDIYLKCHPREPESVKQALASMFPQLKLIDNSVSAEILFLNMRNKIKNKILLVGPPSTAFVTARVILGDKVEIACVLDPIADNPSIATFFKKMDIEVKSIT
jgi:hypothetical protein